MTGKLDIQPDPAALARHVADWLLDRAMAKAGKTAIALSGGSTPKALFALLATPDYARRMPWERLELWWGDERFVPHDHPESNYGMTRAALLDHVPIPAGNVHPIPTGGTPEEAAQGYERALRQAYGAEALDPSRPLFDVTFLGLGEDGHTASLIPGQPVLNERTKWVAAVGQGRPEVRITLTYPALESSAVVAFLIAGAGKAQILAQVRDGGADVPAARLRPQGELIWFVDRAAAGG
ncbi:MAG: 6-phosphogluconolactonase [Acidisphaera sp.]|nr:6-phosphogluconolactonase [Acidisphaera sp.]